MSREQFIALVKETQGALRRFLVSLCCGDGALADDLAQETYIKAYLSCDGLRDKEKFTGWLYRIAYNTFISQRRSARPTEPIEGAAAIAGGEEADSALRYQALYAALERLSERERTAIVLFYLEGYPGKDIAAVMDASPEAVRQYLSRGRSHLKNFLTQ